MRYPLRLSPRAWWLVPLAALCLTALISLRRSERVLGITALGGAAPAADARSATGYAGGVRQLIVPERNLESYQWITQTQQQFAEGVWRVRHTDLDNTPAGREVHTTSPYRWWLALVAWCDQALSGRPLGQSVERAALLAGPLLKAVTLLAAAAFTARYFGALAAVLVSLGWVGLYPFSAGFLPGQPDSLGLAQFWMFASGMALIAGIGGEGATADARRPRRRFILAGICGGIALWVNVRVAAPLVTATALGGLFAAWTLRRNRAEENDDEPDGAPLPWFAWGAAGAATSAFAFLLEYAPAHLGSARLESLHPAYAVSWLGLVIVVGRLERWIRLGERPAGVGVLLRLILGLAALAVLPAALALRHSTGFLLAGPTANRLASLPESPVADSLTDWATRDGLTTPLVLTLLPLLLALVAVWVVQTTRAEARHRAALVLALCPAAAAVVWAFVRLRWWGTVDVMLLPVAALAAQAAASGALGATRKAAAVACAVVLLVAGVAPTLPEPRRGSEETVTENDVESLIERDLAQWLANRMGSAGARVLASPGLTASLAYYGGVRGLATPYWENQDGFQAAVRIASATLPDEAQALAARRKLTHFVLASWSPGLDEIAQLGANGNEHSLVNQLHAWMPPRWLRPVAYELPKISGFEGQTLALFEVVEVQDNVTALARLAEYFAETGEIPSALAVVGTLLHHFPNDPSATAARAQVALARRDRAEFTAAVQTLEDGYSQPAIDELPWDRRVSVALVLAQAERLEHSRATAQACLAQVDEERLRSVSAASLFRFLALTKVLGMEFPEPALRERALSLLSPEMRAAL